MLVQPCQLARASSLLPGGLVPCQQCSTTHLTAMCAFEEHVLQWRRNPQVTSDNAAILATACERAVFHHAFDYSADGSFGVEAKAGAASTGKAQNRPRMLHHTLDCQAPLWSSQRRCVKHGCLCLRRSATLVSLTDHDSDHDVEDRRQRACLPRGHHQGTWAPQWLKALHPKFASRA